VSTTPKTIRLYWEDFPAGSVREFGGKTLTREAIIAFATEFDPRPFHIDEEAGRNSVLGGLCASGWHTCVLAMRMMCDEYLLESASLGSPGVEHIKWLKPVFPGDTLRVRLQVMEARPMASRPTAGLVRTHWQVLNQRDEPVLTMEGWNMFGRRPRQGEGPAQQT